MKVMLAAIEAGAMDKPVAALRATGADAHGVVCDVADPIRAEVEDRFAAILAAIAAFSDQ